MSKVRERIVIPKPDEKRILRGLERLVEDREFAPLRLRAFVYILWDGALRGRAALGLNIEEVIASPTAQKIRAVSEVRMRACEENRYRRIEFGLSDRSRRAIEQYLVVLRRDGWLPSKRLEGPLFVSTQHKGTGSRMSARTPHNIWRGFLADYIDDSMDYGLDDIVYTARTAVLEAAGGDTSKLAEHADLHSSTAGRYRDLATRVAPPTRRTLSKSRRSSVPTKRKRR